MMPSQRISTFFYSRGVFSVNKESEEQNSENQLVRGNYSHKTREFHLALVLYNQEEQKQSCYPAWIQL